jgi:soluble lytic murein transglycosylase-like protein
MPPFPSAARRPVRLALALVVAFALAPAAAAGPEACEDAAAEAARTIGIPASILQAIALTETGRRLDGRVRPWPWAVNLEGQGHWFASRAEALSFARRSLREGRRSFDMGCFQINHHFHGDRFPSLEAMLDPMTGALYAARFLRELHDEFGDWSAAAGAYHSRTPAYADGYRRRFDTILASLGGAAVPGEAVEKHERPPRGTVRRVRGPRIITLAPDVSLYSDGPNADEEV